MAIKSFRFFSILAEWCYLAGLAGTVADELVPEADELQSIMDLQEQTESYGHDLTLKYGHIPLFRVLCFSIEQHWGVQLELLSTLTWFSDFVCALTNIPSWVQAKLVPLLEAMHL